MVFLLRQVLHGNPPVPVYFVTYPCATTGSAALVALHCPLLLWTVYQILRQASTCF
ncbi:hypothetical protein CLOBOL_03320 [Enterocloster bolteae ATCC BAA-613]|uniref:Uncharacterized protein n=1 Tax=Enterocloster bolteae (strain ATCC BAA-613 / DSM 15670 / CCUG 46953 / JCM 12243 / WAL 16351) TaxID=411902 RepID=A8RSH2_ENTBW|nr:hypothetical protein CLOBOL_03320 [Enterocloster bolteae ATCC BAA-613]